MTGRERARAMKVKVHWRAEIEGVTEVAVDAQAVLEWANDVLGNGTKMADPPITEVTAELAGEFLQAGDGTEWEEQIDHARDVKPARWADYEIEKVERA